MSKRIFCTVLLIATAIFGLLAVSGILLAQGRSPDAFERVREAQERHTNGLLAMGGVEGTAIGLNENGRLAIKVFTARPGVAGIPKTLDGVPVKVVVTGKFYALPKPDGPPGQDKKDPPPAAPTGLTATAVSSSQINLDWADNSESDLSYYNVYRSTTSGGPYSSIASNVTSNSYTDTDDLAPLIYYYVVTAVDSEEHESDYSNEAWATTDPGTEPPKPPLWCERPVPIGVSTGHPDITAGTIGCRVTDGTNVYALSNNHVYANSNKATIGDNVLQPGRVDGGVDPDDAIGTLFDFEWIEFGPRGSNMIDAAIALTNTNIVDNATPSDGYGTPSSDIVIVTYELLPLPVQKYGRTTGQTTGVVDSINATIKVRYSGGFAIFVNQIVITPGTFSAGGDSGSLIVTQSGNNPVGLLFAGSSTMTVANPIDAVLEAFGVTIDGEE